jgi:signal transduction histidine kinase
MLPPCNTAANRPEFHTEIRSMSHDNTNESNNNPTPQNKPGKKVVSPPMRKSTTLPPRHSDAGPNSADHLTTLAHDLSNLIDGSMRWLSLAVTQMDPNEIPNTNEPNDQLDAARQQIDTVQQTLHRMSNMVNTAMRSHTVPIGSPMLGVSEAINTAMAIDHAVDVVRPLASQAGVRIEIDINQSAGSIPVGPLYTVILNALFNSIQSISRATKADSLDPGGLIQIAAIIDQSHDELVITISDDGVGLSPGTNPELPFKHTNTSSESSTGIGLSIARQIVDQLEGVITLTNRPNQSTTTRPGALLTVRVPIPHQDESNPGDRLIG